MEALYDLYEFWQFLVFANIEIPMTILLVVAVVIVPLTLVYYWVRVIEYVRTTSRKI